MNKYGEIIFRDDRSDEQPENWKAEHSQALFLGCGTPYGSFKRPVRFVPIVAKARKRDLVVKFLSSLIAKQKKAEE